MSSVVPLFKGRGFDDEVTQILGKAHDIACRSLHRGQPPVVPPSSDTQYKSARRAGTPLGSPS
jgi:hypothetical protein